jgi:hypothetical protein
MMKKTKAGRGFWNWLMGHGWDTAGGNGLSLGRFEASDCRFNHLASARRETGAFAVRVGAGAPQSVPNRDMVNGLLTTLFNE